MSDRDAEFVAVRWEPTAGVALTSVVVASSVLLAASVFGEFGQAAGTVGIVLAEALGLYVGYGALTRVLSPAARKLLGST